MSKIFPEAILNLPESDMPLPGLEANLSQGTNHQIIFMEFSKDVELAEHTPASGVLCLKDRYKEKKTSF